MKLLLASAFLAIATAAPQCQMIDWWEHKNDVNFVGTQIGEMMNEGPILDMIKKNDPHSVPGHILEKLSLQKDYKFIYDFRVNADFDHLNLAGHSGVKIIPIEAVNSKELRFAFEFNEIELKAKANVRLSQMTQSGCNNQFEEEYLGLCYKKCSILTGGSYPRRSATNTCTKNGCDPGHENQAGLCYPRCRDKFKGVGPVCWGRCNELYGNDYKDTGLTCHRWWPPHSKSKPSYGRGVGILPYKPWTKGLGCNGFGVNKDGGCATPYWRLCFTDNLLPKGPGQCQPGNLFGSVDMHLIKPRIEIRFKADIPICPGPGEDGDDLHKDVACVARAIIYIALGALDSSAGSALENFAKFKSMIARFSVSEVKLLYDEKSRVDLDVGGSGFVGWVLSFVKSEVQKQLATDAILIQDVFNNQLFKQILVPMANKAMDKELSGNPCR